MLMKNILRNKNIVLLTLKPDGSDELDERPNVYTCLLH